MEQGFRGVFFWQVAADRLPDGCHPLQEAARKAWQENSRTGEVILGRRGNWSCPDCGVAATSYQQS